LGRNSFAAGNFLCGQTAAVAEIHSHVKGEMNGCRKQPPLTYPAISANMQLWAVSRSSTFPFDYHSVFYAIFRVYTKGEIEPFRLSLSILKSFLSLFRVAQNLTLITV